MISKEEWNRTAEHAAAASYGEEYRGWIMTKRVLAGPLGVVLLFAALVGALAWGAYWLWNRAAEAFTGTADLPGGGFWLAGGALLVVTLIAYRPGAYPSIATLITKSALIVTCWLVWLGFLVGSLAS